MYIYKSKYFAKKAAIIIMLILIVVACNKNNEQPTKEDTAVSQKTEISGQQSENVAVGDKKIEEANEDGGEDTEKNAGADVVTDENTKVDAAIDNYKDKVSKLRDSISDVCRPMRDLDTSDLDKAIVTIKKVITDVTPLYKELGDLVAPESYKGQQIKLKNGSKETIELLNISSAVLEFQKNKNKSEETDKKLSELQAKMMSMQIRVKEMNEALDEITKK